MKAYPEERGERPERSKERVQVILGLGANHGDRRDALQNACRRLSEILDGCLSSSFYETPAVGVHSKGSYLNAVVCGMTGEAMEDLDAQLKEMERNAGRDDEARRRGEVPLDIDIVIYNGSIYRPRDYSQHFFQRGYRELTDGRT